MRASTIVDFSPDVVAQFHSSYCGHVPGCNIEDSRFGVTAEMTRAPLWIIMCTYMLSCNKQDFMKS
jgi:hypothetical protein